MSESPSISMMHRAPLGFVDRIVALASWAVGGAVFLTIGWNAMAPDDPLGAVSVFSRIGGLGMIVQAAGIAAVCAAIATVLAGRKLVDVGTFAVTLGLALVSLRGGTVLFLLQRDVATGLRTENALACRFAAEAVGWMIVVFVAMIVSAGIECWILSDFRRSRDSDSGRAGDGPPRDLPAGLDVPRVSAKLVAGVAPRGTPPGHGLKHAMVFAGLGLATLSALSASLTTRSIEHGQVCFVVAASVLISSYIAHRVTPVRSALWPVVGVGVMVLAAYLWAAVRPPIDALPPLVPSSHFLRILPIQFVSVGVATAIVCAWYNLAPGMEDPGGS